jgi:opacity protein-like surface antigen
MKISAIAVASISLLALASSASAAGWYVGLGGGYSSMTDTDITASMGSLKGSASTEFNGNGRYLVTGGYAFDKFRVEGEYNYAENRLKLSNAAAVGVDSLKIVQNSFLVNALYDYPITSKWNLTAGAGIGYASSNLNLKASGVKVTSDADSFAWQLIAGVADKITDHVTLQLDYRYSALNDLDFSLPANASFKASSVASHNIIATLRYSIGG